MVDWVRETFVLDLFLKKNLNEAQNTLALAQKHFLNERELKIDNRLK